MNEVRKQVMQDILKIAEVQLKSGSSDHYGHGLYNGLITAAAIVESNPNKPDETLQFETYLERQRQ